MNHLTIIGYLGRDPEFSETATGTKICRMSVGVTERIKGEDSTTWFNVVAFGQRADHCKRGLVKGSRVCIRGPHRSRRYMDKEGNHRTDWSVNVDYIEFLSSPSRERQHVMQRETKEQPQTQWGQPANSWHQPVLPSPPQEPTQLQTGWDQYKAQQDQQPQYQTGWDQYQAQQNQQPGQPVKHNPDIPF
ncbi:MAG: single-stranded DNA-binding protein, partial [Marivivens sp.]|nr:single-stranded DNA-binding protein [Marivivens sp.]